MKRVLSMILVMAVVLCGCSNDQQSPHTQPGAQPTTTPATTGPAQSGDGEILIQLSGDGVRTEAPADSVYTANDIVYYEEGHDFTYGEGTPSDEHTASEAAAHTVVHIAQPGTYRLTGELSAGQVAVDLGEDARENPDAVVNLILDGVDITCTVAPAVIFYNVYECGSDDTEAASQTVDTSAAGANVWIADGTVNQITGSHVARIYKDGTQEYNEDKTEVLDAGKLHKYDGAFYSKMSMNIYGNDGILNIQADNEGLDSELHLTINGGNINIVSGNDGINTNEDGVSVTTVNGGSVSILVDGSTGEGDGIDSNGWLVINGGTVAAQACAFSGDAGIDSDMGIYLNGGNVMATGNMLDRIAGGELTYAVFQFSTSQTGGTYTLKNTGGTAVMTCQPENGFIYLLLAGDGLTLGTYTFWNGETQLWTAMGGTMPGGQMEPGTAPALPEGETFPADMENMMPPQGMERPEMPEGMEPPEGMEFPQGKEPGRRPGRGQGNAGPDAVTSEFTINQGGNYFTSVSPAA